MAGHLLQLNFKLSIPVEQYEHATEHAAQAIANVAGLRWKIWIVNAAEHEAGGLYCFESREAADAYLNGPIVANLKGAPFASEVSVKRFDYLEGHTALTRGPVGEALQGVS
jgi:Putative mono-oxygenase ydhR